MEISGIDVPLPLIVLQAIVIVGFIILAVDRLRKNQSVVRFVRSVRDFLTVRIYKGVPGSEDSRPVVRVDPLILLGAVVVLFLRLSSEPWWTMTGAVTGNLLTMQVSPYYFETAAIGLSRSAPFVDLLGSFTRMLLTVGLLGLAASSVRPTAWWRDLAVYFGLCSLAELYLSFLLMYQGAQTALLGAYGVIPPYLLSGDGSLPARVIGLDFNTYTNPPVTGGFGFPFYLGFFGLAVLGGRLVAGVFQHRKRRIGRKGVAAIFTSENNDRDQETNSPVSEHVPTQTKIPSPDRKGIPDDRPAQNEVKGVSLRIWTVLLAQFALIVGLSASLINEFVHNPYFQIYLTNLLSMNYGNILLVTMIVIIALVLINGLRAEPSPSDKAKKS